ncbi:CD3e molecule, epsilon associated protein [Rhinichthys klamathensis goyatoka]|uniref:CD3e molecule, epsilon associated protein n=1 Tax=Rhinichthys klamathensis goyatoka TaxID=3034132 RepID=UPI0024B48BA4|nr:CD3e molecule, epsilon associated protein [Rhinichthys klamathensis goyatoka]
MSQNEDEGFEQTSVAQKKVSKYQCPDDFVAVSYDASVNDSWDGDEQKELWLIKAPARFDPKSFKDLKLPISGLKRVQSCGTAPQIYSVLSGRTAPSDLHLLVTKGKKQKTSLCSSGFSGVLKISESYGNCSENQDPIPIPAAPAPCIPAGLKQRFQPFGSSIAAHMKDEVTVVSPTTPKRTRQDLNEGEERKKKKKKKKDKRQDDSETLFIKQEQTQMDCDQLESSEFMEEESMEERRRKKKKIKKEKERQSEDMVDESLISKTEPLDPYDYNDTPGKTKKKKKKTSRDE